MNHFAYPYAFLLLLLPVLIRLILPAVKGLHGDALKVPFIKDLKEITSHSKGWGLQAANVNILKLVLIYVVWFFLVTAIARPQLVGEPIRVKNYSRDILMVVDISTSMLEPDFSINNRRITRMAAVKLAAGNFIDERTSDRIGLILFGTRAYLQAPITFDKQSVKEVLYTMEPGMAGNSTSIGDALGLALKTLKDERDLDKKVIILLTDGENNDGALTVPDAISLAAEEDIKIYTIGVGSESMFNSLFSSMGFNNGGIDEAGLQKIAEVAQGKYFRAKNTKSLINIYNEIDKLEPTINEENYIRETKDLYYIPLLTALVLGLLLLFLARRVE